MWLLCSLYRNKICLGNTFGMLYIHIWSICYGVRDLYMVCGCAPPTQEHDLQAGVDSPFPIIWLPLCPGGRCAAFTTYEKASFYWPAPPTKHHIYLLMYAFYNSPSTTTQKAVIPQNYPRLFTLKWACAVSARPSARASPRYEEIGPFSSNFWIDRCTFAPLGKKEKLVCSWVECPQQDF